MPISHKKSRKEILSKSTLLMAAGTLLATGQDTIAAEPIVDASAAENTSAIIDSVVTQIADVIPQPIVVPEAAARAPQFSQQSEAIEHPPEQTTPTITEAATKISTTAADLAAATLSPTGASTGTNAQTVAQADAPGDEAEGTVSQNYSAADLEIPARFGVNGSTATNGFGETIGVQGFLPLDQNIEDLNELDVTFLEGDLQVNDGDPSFSLSLGHRGYRQDEDETTDEGDIRGGYVGIDGRFTDESSFFQLATGYERIDDDWEFRINGYLPIGDRTNTIRNIDTDTGLQTSTGFAGNQLVLSAIRERQRILEQEDALGGFDAEFGAELDEWDGGELMGYVGGYLLSGEESSLGGQARLAVNFDSNFNAGLSLQHDGLFGTTVALSIGATWPELRFQEDEENEFEEEFEVPIRLRDPIARRDNVAVNIINESEIIFDEETEPLRNPEEEEDYRFVHVALGGAAGDGTYESPFATVDDAITLINSDPTTYSDGNTIVYVDGEIAAGSTIPGFTIPDRVRVLSQGPEQIIAGMEFSIFPSTATRLPFSADQNFNVDASITNANGITVSLPDSNDGVFPTITGGSAADLVTLGNNTVLAGFQIDGATQHGVTGSAIDNVELRNNLISNSGGSGIFLNDVGGSAILFDNVVNNSTERGIFIENTSTDRPLQATIAGFDLNNNQVGMDFSTIATAGTEFPSQIISVGPSSTANTSVGTPGGTALTTSILNSTDEGLVLRAEGDSLTAASTQQLTVNDTTIDTSGSDGLQVVADVGVHQQLFTLDNGTITNSGGNGIAVINGDTAINGSVTVSTPDGASPQEIVITNSQITNNALDGIDITLLDAGAQELFIQGNQIVNNGGNGIDSVAQTASVQEWRTDNDTGALGISGNTITGNGGQAITLDLEDVAILPVVGIGNNTISGNGATPDIAISTDTTLPAGSVNACLVLEDNVTTNSIEITAPDPTFNGNIASVQVQDLADLVADTNVVFLVNDFFLGLTPSTAGYVNVTDRCIQ